MFKIWLRSSKAKDPDSFFKTEHLAENLKNRSIRGGAVTVSAQILRFLLQMGGTLIIARLLSPEDFGLIGMVTVVIQFVELFKDLGLSTATIQKPEINHAQVSTLFWINVALSCIVALIFAALAPLIAWFYGEPRLIWIVIAFSSTFVIGGLTVQHQALLKRQMKFTDLAKIEITSSFISTFTAITSAWYGAGYWSLVLLSLSRAIINVLGVWILCSWKPGLPKLKSDIKTMLAFGGNITGFNVVNYFSRNLDNILIGRYWGAQELGLYAMSYRLMVLPIFQINVPVTSVALPALSQLQNDPEKHARYYFKGILLVTTIGMPILGFMFATADDLFLLVLGEKWKDSILIFRLLTPAAFVGTFSVALGWAFISLGRVDRQLRQGIVASLASTIAIIIGIRWGAIGVAAAYGFSQPLIIFGSLVYCYNGTFLRINNLIKTLSWPTTASVGSAVILLSAKMYFPGSTNLIVQLLIDGVVYSLSFMAIWISLPGGKSALAEVTSAVMTLKPARKMT